MDERPQQPDERQTEHDAEAEGERHMTALQKFVGFVMIVLAWLQLLMSVSSGSDADHFPFVFYFVGLLIFMSGTIAPSWYKYPLMGAATVTGLALIYHVKSLGSAARWEKNLVVYGTIAVVAYFVLFAKHPPTKRINLPPPQE
jgi:hypothetical protein